MYKVPELSKFEWQKAVQSILSTPPLSPSKGDRYLIGSPATDTWENMDGYIAEYDDSDWEFISPFNGMFIQVLDIGHLLKYSTDWIYADKEIVNSVNVTSTLTALQFNETFTINSSENDVTLDLPEAAEDNVGYWFRFVKLGSKNLNIQADSADVISDSTIGGTISCIKTNETTSVLKILIVAANTWIVTEEIGTWATS